MKRHGLVLALLFGSLLNLHANLGDGPELSAGKYGRSYGAAPADIIPRMTNLGDTFTSATYHFDGYTICCVFHLNFTCIAILYKKESGGILDAEANQLIVNNGTKEGVNVMKRTKSSILLGTDKYEQLMEASVQGL